MSASLYIHVLAGCSEEDFIHFMSSDAGSKHYDRESAPCSYLECSRCYRTTHTPKVFVGEVSWLKAAFSGEEEKDKYVPPGVERILSQRLYRAQGIYLELVRR